MDSLDVMREAELRALDVIGRPLPDVLQRLVTVAKAVTGAAVAEIHAITTTSQVTLAATGELPEPCDAGISYCARIVRETARGHLIPDVRLDERFKDSPFTTSGAVITYAAQQLVTHNGVPIGTLCIFDPEPRDVSEHAMEVLAELADAVMDVLETRRRQELLAEAVHELADGSRELRRSNESLAAFAGQVSHDIQGPLASVTMSLQLMEDEIEEGTLDEETSQMLMTRALSGAQRMRTTIIGLMDFAVVGGSLAPMRLDMGAVVSDVLADLSARQGHTRVEIGDLPKVWGDDVQIRAVTQNLVANAFKYAGHVADPVVTLSGTTYDGTTRIVVSDNGPGVPEDQRESIFDLMVRGEGAAESGVEGLGIGLDTCRRIVNAHLGRIGVQESASGGAEFWFELPEPGDA